MQLTCTTQRIRLVCLCSCVVVTFVLSMSSPALGDATVASSTNRYRADLVTPIEGARLIDIDILRPPGTRLWPAPLRERLRQELAREWPSDRRYGPIHSRVALWLEYPLLNSENDSRIIVPVLDGPELPIRGRVTAPPLRVGGRTVVLLDVSKSANSGTVLLTDEGSPEWLPAFRAELVMLRRLLGWLEAEGEPFTDAPGPSEIGIIAFGESTWPLVEPERSIQTVRSRLESHTRDWPEGAGRTDAVCALRLARDWLEGPSGPEGQIIILTDGDLPFSGRFTDCDAPHLRRRSEKQACLASLNRSPCRASHQFREDQGRSDVAQLFAFVRDTQGTVPVFPMLFRLDRPPRFYRELARYTGARSDSIASTRQVDRAISSLFTRDENALDVRGVFARNLQTSEVTGNLLDPDGTEFEGALPLLPGSNDIELRIESDRGEVGLFRFRVYAASRFLRTYLDGLEDTNRQLERRLEELSETTRDRMRPPVTREIAIEPEAAAEPPPPDLPPSD